MEWLPTALVLELQLFSAHCCSYFYLDLHGRCDVGLSSCALLLTMMITLFLCPTFAREVKGTVLGLLVSSLAQVPYLLLDFVWHPLLSAMSLISTLRWVQVLRCQRFRGYRS